MSKDQQSGGPQPLRGKEVSQYCGSLDASGIRLGLVCSRFNFRFTRLLAESALDSLAAMGARPQDIALVWVPGAYEIPGALVRMEAVRPADGYLALGLVMQGQTRHAETIDRAVGQALMQCSLAWGKPVMHEVVSVYDEQQAAARCTGGRDSRGWYAAEAAVEMVTLYRSMGNEVPA